MDRRGLLGVALLAFVAVACGAESTTPTPDMHPLSGDPSITTLGLNQDYGDLVAVLGRIPELAGFEILENGWREPRGDTDLLPRHARLAISECEVLDIGTQLSGLNVWYDPPGVRQTLYRPNHSYAALLVRDRIVGASLRPLPTCRGEIRMSFTSDELMVIAESIADMYWVQP